MPPCSINHSTGLHCRPARVPDGAEEATAVGTRGEGGEERRLSLGMTAGGEVLCARHAWHAGSSGRAERRRTLFLEHRRREGAVFDTRVYTSVFVLDRRHPRRDETEDV